MGFKVYALSSLFFLFMATSTVSMASNSVTGKINLLNKDKSARTYRGNIVVFLEPEQATQSFQTPDEPLVISQRGRRFRPAVLPVIKGTSVAFPNDDKVLHNVFSLSKVTPFDLGNYKKGESRSVTFNQTGLVKVYCNIHPKMTLDVLVLNNPYFAKTDKDGNYLIENVPDGTYTLRATHELSAEVNKTIALQGNEIQVHPLEMQISKSHVKHKNKYGKPYRGKY